MVFGDNVRARWAARALPRTPTTGKRRRQREEEDKQRDLTLSHPPVIPQSTTHNTMRQDKTCTVITHCHHHTHTPHALLPNTNHHRYSTMTQPCHKDTALNQQCCDREHKKGKGEEKNTTVHMRQHTPPQHDSVAQHGTAAATRQQCRTPPHFPAHNTQQKEGAEQCEKGRTM